MFEALLISAGALLGSLLCFAAATTILVRVIAPWVVDDSGFWRSVAIMIIVTLIMVVLHLVSIAMWAIVFVVCGELTSLETAFYLSAENYTALGYGDLVLSERWRLLGPLEAVNGLLLMALSTAGMVAVMNQLVANRLRRQGLRWSQWPEPLSGDQRRTR